MTPNRLLVGSALALAITAAGCASQIGSTPAVPGTEAPTMVTQREARDLTFQYRQRAREFEELAQQMEVEAQWYGARFGEQDERAKNSRDKAKELWMAAEEADRIARTYRQQMPHGQVY